MPTSFVHLSGSSRPGLRTPRVRSADERGDARRGVAGRGAAQRVRQKATRAQRRSGDGAPKIVERTCVGCGHTGDATELLRVVHVPELTAAATGAKTAALPVMVDLGGKLDGGKRPGRGAWMHPQRSCIERACARGFSKAFATRIQVSAGEVIAQICFAAERRLVGLFLASARSRQLVYGRDAVKEVLSETPLIILATDAQAVAKDGDLQRAGLDGKVVCWSTKAQLGHWLGRSEVGVVAITDASIADVMRRTIALTGLTQHSPPLALESGTLEAPETINVSAEKNAHQELKGTAGLMSSADLSSAGTSDGAGRDEELSEVR